MAQDSQISDERIKEIISKSGYLEEQKVMVEFRKQGFFAGSNYSFEDQDEHKSREVDFIVSKYTDFTIGKTGFYFSAYGEVKKRRNPLVFLGGKALKQEHPEVFIPIVATQEFFSYTNPPLDIKKILKFCEIHHQAKHDFTSTQFCEIHKDKAQHGGLYEALFVPLLKCIDSEMSSMRKRIPFFDPNHQTYFLNLFQPVIVISGPLYTYNVYDDSLRKTNYILYRRHYDSKTIKRTLLIDIVAKDYLRSYISEKLMKTYQAIENSLREQMSQIIGYCIRDRFIQGKKVKEILRKQGYRA